VSKKELLNTHSPFAIYFHRIQPLQCFLLGHFHENQPLQAKINTCLRRLRRGWARPTPHPTPRSSARPPAGRPPAHPLARPSARPPAARLTARPPGHPPVRPPALRTCCLGTKVPDPTCYLEPSAKCLLAGTCLYLVPGAVRARGNLSCGPGKMLPRLNSPTPQAFAKAKTQHAHKRTHAAPPPLTLIGKCRVLGIYIYIYIYIGFNMF
jgi:hypothetical protein